MLTLDTFSVKNWWVPKNCLSDQVSLVIMKNYITTSYFYGVISYMLKSTLSITQSHFQLAILDYDLYTLRWTGIVIIYLCIIILWFNFLRLKSLEYIYHNMSHGQSIRVISKYIIWFWKLFQINEPSKI